MGKSDFVCSRCKKVITHSFFNPFPFKRYECPDCGILCSDCVKKSSIIGRNKCKNCRKKVLAYEYKDKRWQQI